MNSKEGVKHVEKVFDIYAKYINEDIAFRKKALIESMQECEELRLMSHEPCFYALLALESLRKVVDKNLDEINQDVLLIDAYDHLTC